MRFLIVTIGTAGDVHPYIAVALALKRRGHEVTMVANPHFADRITRVGLGHRPMGAEAEYDRFVTHPGLMGGIRGPIYVLREFIVPAIGPTAAAIAGAHAQTPFDGVFAHFICFGAPRAAEKLGIPCVSGVLAPMFWNSRHDRSRWAGLPDSLPAWIDRPVRRLMRRGAGLLFDPIVNRALEGIGAPRSRDFAYHEGRGESVDRRGRRRAPSRAVLGLWSPELRPARDDDPELGRICGFTWFDRGAALSAPDERELRAFLSAGPPPVVVTLGSSVVHHGQDLYPLAEHAARRVGRRLVLLGARPVASAAPNDAVFRLSYAPFSRVLPHGCCTVHHGGIGTTAHSMRAGVPSVIIPFANDEFDNAARAARLGVSVTLARRRLNERTLAESIERACTDHAMVGTARVLGQKLLGEDGAEVAADHLERLAALARVNKIRRPPAGDGGPVPTVRTPDVGGATATRRR